MPRSAHQASGVSGRRAFSAEVGRSRGTGPRATGGEKPPLHRRARACPSPCTDLRCKPPWSLGCGRFPQWSRDRGGQAPALRVEKSPLTVGRGPVPRHRSRYGNIETRRALLPGRHRDMKHPQLIFFLCVDRVAPSAATRLCACSRKTWYLSASLCVSRVCISNVNGAPKTIRTGCFFGRFFPFGSA